MDKPVRFATIVVTSLLLFLAVFTVTMVVMYWTIGSVPDVLIGAVYGLAGCELVALAAKRIFTDKKKEDSDV